MSDLELEYAHVVCPQGFVAGGTACGIKTRGASDLAVILCREGASAAGMFTRNLVRAAPVDITEEHLRDSGGRAHAVMISSGCANAATGAEGRERAERTVNELARLLSCEPRDVLVNSTGVIGVQLPEDRIVAALPGLLPELDAKSLPQAARAIMTTDTRPKTVQATVTEGGRTLHVAGIAKGSGMIHPDMATMIGVLLTDAALPAEQLNALLRDAVDHSFHRISVDGDTSTNDCVLALASGRAGPFAEELVQRALRHVARDLALMIVRDGEGARKLMRVHVEGARTRADALRVARTVASSLLVRTAVTGGDPNWGRILAAVGRSGVDLDPAKVRLFAGEAPLFADGAPLPTPLEEKERAFQSTDVLLRIDLGLGDAREEFFTCDLTEGYVHINADYTT